MFWNCKYKDSRKNGCESRKKITFVHFEQYHYTKFFKYLNQHGK